LSLYYAAAVSHRRSYFSLGDFGGAGNIGYADHIRPQQLRWPRRGPGCARRRKTPLHVVVYANITLLRIFGGGPRHYVLKAYKAFGVAFA
jgi:hypothetical protein